MTSTKGKKSWIPIRIFDTPVDFYELLERQAAKTVEGVEAMRAWLLSGAEERGQIVRNLEKEADEMKHDLERRLVESFVTPFDREDIYDLSARLDEVINGAKYIVREVE